MHGVGCLHRIHHHDSFDRGLILNAAHFQKVFLGRDENHARARVPQNVCRLFPGQGGVDRHDHRPDEQAGEVRDRPLRAVLAQDGNPVSLGDAPFAKRASHPHHALVELQRRSGNPLDWPPVHHHHAIIPIHHREEDFVNSSQAHGQLKVQAFSREAAQEYPREMYWFHHREATPIPTRVKPRLLRTGEEKPRDNTHKNRRRMRPPQTQKLTLRSEVVMINLRGGAVW